MTAGARLARVSPSILVASSSNTCWRASVSRAEFFIAAPAVTEGLRSEKWSHPGLDSIRRRAYGVISKE